MAEQTFGEWLQRQRKSIGLTQAQLAKKINCSTSALRKFESEERRPSEPIVEQLAEVFNIPIVDRGSFLRFARGSMLVHLPGKIENRPWHISTKSHLSNIPVSNTNFIGRERQQGEIAALVANNPLVTLTGVGGIGKTRLALEIGKKLLPVHPEGVWLVELASINDPALVIQTVATILGVDHQTNDDILTVLIAVIREKKLLLILDNCEHLLNACIELVYKMLENCPSLKVLTTSREALGIEGEALYNVPPLTLPELHLQENPDLLREYESIQLFYQRARLQLMSFSVTEDNIFNIVKICNRLEGIPLAIELAAARVSSISLQQILVRLDDCFNLLKAKRQVRTLRHETLRATIDWSHELLDTQEKALFRRLAVFSGGWSLDAVEYIGKVGSIRKSNVVNLLTSLVEKSLVVVEADGLRYNMLEIVKQYAKEKLDENGEAVTYYQAHLDYFLKLSEDAESHLIGEDQQKWIIILEEEIDNLRAVLDWSINGSDKEAGLKICGAIWRFWQRSMRASEGRMYLNRILEQKSRNNAGGTVAYAKALTAAGALAYFQGDYNLAEVFRRESLNVYRTLGDKNGIAESLHGLGNIELSKGNYNAAHTMYEGCLKIRHELNQRDHLAGTLSNLGLIAYSVGDLVKARSLAMESRILFQEYGNKAGVGFTLNLLGNIAQRQGDLHAARKYLEESIFLCEQVVDQWGLANALNSMADLNLVEENFAEAELLCRKSFGLLQQGEVKDGVVICIEILAAIAQVSQRLVRSAKLFGAAAEFRKNIKLPIAPIDLPIYEFRITTLRNKLGETKFKTAWEDGQMMSFDQLINYAIFESP